MRKIVFQIMATLDGRLDGAPHERDDFTHPAVSRETSVSAPSYRGSNGYR